MTTPAMRLGAFELHTPLAKGGQGEVWQGIHVAQQEPVAIKVVTSTDLHHPELVAALQAEVRAVAGLDHPHVIRVFDAGEVDAEAATASEGRFAQGAPWLAMELVAGGTLNDLDDPGWPVIREVLLDLLDALAHAHARGVVHRDLKTANVLFHPDGHLVLSDFGMVYALERRKQATPAAGGTPVWMAPEQFVGTFADQGPWTDLYSLGCLAWALVCRKPPFRGRSWVRLMMAHLEHPLPRLQPKVEVPEGFEPWVRRMTAKAPRDRFRRAADAAWVLASMGRQVREPRVLVRPGAATPATVPSGGLGSSVRTTLFLPSTPDLAPDRAATPPSSMAAIRSPQMPPHWRRGPSRRPAGIAGTGLGLWGLRDVPVVGRRRERDALWGALSDVNRRRGAAAVLLRGPAGVGKTRLARWLVRRAHEVGAATPLRATHSATAGPGDGLPGLVARAVRATSAEPVADLRERIERDLPSELLEPLLELLSPHSEPVHLKSPEDRWALFVQLVPRLCEGRPALVWVEDAQWAAETLRGIHWVLDQPTFPPILFVVAARDEALREQPEVAALVDELDARQEGSTVRLGPLPAGDRHELVASLIGLDEQLVSQVDLRSGGNPLFAVQLVGDWIARGVLRAGPTGFSLAEGADTTVPPSVGALWRGRIERVLAAGPSEWRTALYLAALLGSDVEQDEWCDACLAADMQPPHPLVVRLFEERLAVVDPASQGTRWSFVHGLLRETIEEMVLQEEGRGALHRACAAMLVGRGPSASERRARHLIGAEQWPDALEALGEAAAFHHARDTRAAQRALELQLEVLERIGGSEDLARGHTYIALSRVHFLRNDPDQQELYAARAQRIAESSGDVQLHADAAHERATAAGHRGQLRVAIGLLKEALGLREQQGWGRAIALTLGELGQLQTSAGLYEDAARSFRHAMEVTDHPVMLDWLGSGLAGALEHGGQLAAAWEALDVRRRHVMEQGTPLQQAQLLHVESRCLLREGDVKGAADRLREVLRLRDAVGLPSPSAALDLGLILLSRGQFDDADELLARYDQVSSTADFLHGSLAARTLLHAQRQHWQAFDATVDAAQDVYTEWANPGLTEVWRLASEAAVAAGFPDRAARATALADERARWCATGAARTPSTADSR